AVWCSAALGLFVALSSFSAWQLPWPDAFRAPSAFSWNWWLYPLEHNRTLRLPRVAGSFHAVSTPRAGQVWAVGDGGLILHSDDAGASWKRQRLFPGSTRESAASSAVGAQNDLSTVQFFDERNGWAGGRPGMFSTSNGGETWVQRAREAGLERGVEELSFSDVSRGCVVRDPKLQCTTTGGRTWISAQIPVPFVGSVSCQSSYCAVLTLPLSVMFIDFTGRYLGDFSRYFGKDVQPLGIRTRIRTAGTRQFLAAGREGIYSFSFNAGMRVTHYRAPTSLMITDVAALDAEHAWATGTGGLLVTTADSGMNWQPHPTGVKDDLLAVSFSDLLTGWAVGAQGVVIATTDGGATWVRQTRLPNDRALGRYIRWPAPWYYASLLLVLLVLRQALRPPDPTLEPSVADLLMSDRPIDAGEPDAFDFATVARGLSHFLRNEKTQPPLTVAITGEWGSGKSSLMNLLRAALARHGWRQVRFNAWHHQKEKHLLASLLAAIRRQAIPPLWTFAGLAYRANLLRIRWGRYRVPMFLLLLFLAFATGLVLSDPQRLTRTAG